MITRDLHGALELSAVYNPSLWLNWILAVLATIGSGFLVFLVSRVLGFAAAPGLVLWYFIIKRMRSEDFTYDLRAADEIVLSESEHRVAVRARLAARDVWLGFAVPEGTKDLFQLLAQNSRCRTGEVRDAASRTAIIVLVLIATIWLFIVFMALTSR